MLSTLSLIVCSVSLANDIRQQPIAKGQRAPFEGVVITRDAMAKLITDFKAEIKAKDALIDKLQKDTDAKLASAEQRCELNKTYLREKLARTSKQCDLEKSILMTAVDRNAKAAERKWYESPWIPFIGGMAVCAGSVAAGISLDD